MNQRFTNARMMRVLGTLPDGNHIYPIFGAEDPPGDGGNGGNSGSSGTNADPPKDGDGGNANAGGDGNKNGEGGDPPKPDTVSKEEYDTAVRRANAADKSKSELQKKLDDLDKAKLGEKERAEKERDDEKKAHEATAAALRQTRLENKFLASNKYNWHDPETALALVDLTDVEIDEDGKVKGLEAAMKKLAEAKPFLVKSGDDTPKNGASGGTPKPPGGGDKGSAARAALEKKYPSLLRGRITNAGV